jgi:integrase
MSGLEPATISTYKSKIRTFNNWLILKRYDELDISAISNKVIIDFFVYLNNDRKSSSVTYRKYRNLLTEFFDYLIEKDIIQINPVVRLPICRRVVDKSPKPIRSEDVEIILKELKRRKMYQLYLFIAFEYYCFMRPGEIRLMKISWIDWGNGIVRIPKDMNKTKTNKMPIIPDEFMHELRDEQKLHLKPRDYFVIGKNKEPGEQATGKNTMRNRFNKIRDFLEMPSDYMLYSWKHTGNIALEESGANGYERMMQNGHTSLVTTEKYTRGKMGFKSETIRHKFPALG